MTSTVDSAVMFSVIAQLAQAGLVGAPPAYRADDLTAVALLSFLSVVVVTGFLAAFFIVRYLRSRHARDARRLGELERQERSFLPGFFDGPCRWMAIRATNLAAVQAALGLQHPRRCSWREAVTTPFEPRLFIAPPVDGWTLVFGVDLPDPADDVDECYRFLASLSRRLGLVQFFSVNRVVNHHAWARLANGDVLRAYAWAEEVVWNQGDFTGDERALQIHCFDYGEGPAGWEPDQRPFLADNTERVVRLAASWSLDPSSLDKADFKGRLGIAGALHHSKFH